MLATFYEQKDNKPFVGREIIRHCGQGLVYSYWIELVGNGYNTYHFTVINDEKIEIQFDIDEKYITSWKIWTADEEDEGESIDFSAYATMDGKNYEWLYGTDADHINGYQIKDITVTNDYPDVPMKSIDNEYQFIDKIQTPAFEAVQQLKNSLEKIKESREEEEEP